MKRPAIFLIVVPLMIGIFLPPMRRSWLISVLLDDASTASKLCKTLPLCHGRRRVPFPRASDAENRRGFVI
jgi:hypothetical protein